MLTRIDRVVLAAPDRHLVGQRWETLLGAELDSDDAVASLSARRARYRIGDGWVEILEPDGAGPVAHAVAARGAHLFAAGAATPDLAALADHVDAEIIDGQVLVDMGRGLRLVVNEEEELPVVGALDYLYEVTHLVEDAGAAADDLAARFELDPSVFHPIASSEYGYAGTLTLFHPDRLHRLEVIHPHDTTKTMGRYFRRNGESLYMCFGESGELPAVEERARQLEAPCTPVGGHTLFLHPQALGGVMLGLSRRTYAWTWSGRPERVEKA